MMNRADLDRLLVEAHNPWADSDEGEAVKDWLERNQIDEEVWQVIGDSIMQVVGEQLVASMFSDDPKAAIGSIVAGFQLAFFVGWESSKSYGPARRDMSHMEGE